MDNTKPWVLIPTAMRPHAHGHIIKWRDQGYNVGLFLDPEPPIHMFGADLVITAKYPGVWKAWNILAKSAIGLGAQVCVLAGDDMDPDPTKSGAEIAAEYARHFPYFDGVMQPCGDLQGMDASGLPAAARICGSPWVGREWIERAYLGKGPVNGDYVAYWADEELLNYAKRKNKLWMRPDLSQFHNHWSWGHLPQQDYHQRNQLSWQQDKDLYDQREKNNFP